jgi:thiopeptide-type bacteriocin biosynthesis protein
MKNVPHSDSVAPAGFFALRTPLLPFDELLAWSAELEAPCLENDSARLDEAIAADRARLRDRLRSIVSRSQVREALFVASPDLEERLDVWLRKPESEAGQKIERALVRYFARMAGRATPFGLSAGCSVGTSGAQTRLVLKGKDQYRRHSRLDMDYVVALTDALTRQPELRQNLTIRPNTSLYRVNGRMRYAEVRRDGKGWSHHRVAIECSDYLTATLRTAAEGARRGELAAALVEADPEAQLPEAEEYVDELINSQILVSELAPAMTGAEPIRPLVSRLRERGLRDAADRLEKAQMKLEAMDAAALGIAPETYRTLARQLEELPAKVDLPRLFQVDMVKPVAEATLDPKVEDEIRRGVQLLQRLFRRTPRDSIARFREAFTARYEMREVPLIEALDEECGVGFDILDGKELDASALLDGLTFPQPKEETVSWGRRETFLLGKLSEALARGAQEILLSPQDVAEMASSDPPPLPEAFSVMATVAARSDAALASGDFRVLLEGASGPSGARLLGRFCHADSELCRLVEQYLHTEEALHPDAVFAEIVHQPEGRVGNIAVRPILRAFEIPYLGQAGVPSDFQIPITDLLVSVVGEEVVLRSARLGKRVIPRLTNAHNFLNGQGIYRFLPLLQMQGVAGWLFWDWGPLKDAPFLPRVVSGRLVLARARWRINQDELRTLGKTQGSTRWRAVQAWRRQRRLPRLVYLAENDHQLPIDLDNVLSVHTFVELVKGEKEATLIELYPGPEELVVQGPEGRFVHELVVPFVRTAGIGVGENRDQPLTQHSAKVRTPQQPGGTRACRSFPPGSEWLYAKLYAGAATVDQILLQVVRPLTKLIMQTGAADRWFFIRYGDPDWHLRLRFHGEPGRLQTQVWPAFQSAVAPLLEDGRVWRVQLDTYEREVERYGGPEGVVLAERLFQADSEAVLALLATLPEDARSDTRWRLALGGVDLLLCDLGFDFAAKSAVMKRLRDAFAREFRVDANLKHQLGEKYRKERQRLEALLDSYSDAAHAAPSACSAFGQRSERLAPVIDELKALEMAGCLSGPLTRLAPSYIHMHINRLLRSAQRCHEVVLYDFLDRLYESRLARLRVFD